MPLYFKNELADAVYIDLRPRGGMLEIHIYSFPYMNAHKLPAGQTFICEDDVENCMQDGVLKFSMHGHGVFKKAWQYKCKLPGEEPVTDGPVFRFFQKTNGASGSA